MIFALTLQRTELRMFGLRLNPPRPFWFEDLMFFVLDEGRRLPARAKDVAARAKSAATHISGVMRDGWQANADAVSASPLAVLREKLGLAAKAQPEIKIRHIEAELLDEPLAWSLATEPLAAIGTGAEAAIALHEAASEQLDALTYVLDRMRDELRPLMAYTQLEHGPIIELEKRVELETSIEALLELSRQNAATRPKGRVLTAA
jgi:hypothetical protein